MSLPERVLGLAEELRKAGAKISVAEATDALEALVEVPIESRSAFKAALSTTLVKDPGHLREFDKMFNIFFPLMRRSSARGDDDGADRPELRERLSRAIREMDPEAMREIAEQAVEEEADIEAGADVDDEHYRYRALRNMDLEDLIRRLVDEEVEGKGTSALQRKLIEEDFNERMARFNEEVAEEIQRRRRQGMDLEKLVMRKRKVPPEEVDFLWAKQSDLEDMRRALFHLARRLALTLSNKRRRAARGRLDMRRTIRRSLSCGGVMLEPRFRRPTVGKPELWVLCDISGSMRSFARFTLELIYTISTQFQRVRSFVFIDSLDEITDKLSVAGDLAEALERIDSEARVVEFDGQSWYGNCLSQFWSRYGRDLTPRVTLLVLGDARNNFRTSGAQVLMHAKAKVRRIWWLNPEPREHWGSSDSIASEFLPHVDGMYEVRNLHQLEAFVKRAI